MEFISRWRLLYIVIACISWPVAGQVDFADKSGAITLSIVQQCCQINSELLVDERISTVRLRRWREKSPHLMGSVRLLSYPANKCKTPETRTSFSEFSGILWFVDICGRFDNDYGKSAFWICSDKAKRPFRRGFALGTAARKFTSWTPIQRISTWQSEIQKDFFHRVAVGQEEHCQLSPVPFWWAILKTTLAWHRTALQSWPSDGVELPAPALILAQLLIAGAIDCAKVE